MSKVNWIAVRTKYTSNVEPISYEKLAEEFDVNTATIAVRAGREGWVKLREETQLKAQAKTIERTTDNIASFQADKLKIGKYIVGVGVKGIQDHAPRNARESKEVVETGYKIATEAMGLNNPANTVVNIQNNIMTIDEFTKKMEERRREREDGKQP